MSNKFLEEIEKGIQEEIEKAKQAIIYREKLDENSNLVFGYTCKSVGILSSDFIFILFDTNNKEIFSYEIKDEEINYLLKEKEMKELEKELINNNKKQERKNKI